MSLMDMAKSLMGENADKLKALEAASHLIGSESDITSLASRFESSSLAATFQSWVSNGANLPITAEQLSGVIGAERVAAISQKVGMTPDQLQSKLSHVLPEVVNRLTTNGKLSHENFTVQNVLEVGKAILASN